MFFFALSFFGLSLFFFGLSPFFLLSSFVLLLLALFLPPVAVSAFLKKLAKALGTALEPFLAAFFASGCSADKQNGLNSMFVQYTLFSLLG